MSLSETVEVCAKDVQETLGPHLRENAYQEALKVALTEEGVQHTEEATIPVMYRGFPVARIHPDMIVGTDERYIIELKVNRDGSDQLQTYLDYSEAVGMDDIVGGMMISFGDGVEVKQL